MRLVEFGNALSDMWISLNVDKISVIRPNPQDVNQTLITIDQIDYYVVGFYGDILKKLGWDYGR